MLKQTAGEPPAPIMNPAAFGRLCVETAYLKGGYYACEPAAFGRLCVETMLSGITCPCLGPAAFGRLCVETHFWAVFSVDSVTSRLRAAVC